ncbi:hypothetical protein C8R43DRAFT_963049 [Mycena crocata]|nr:hypothetical protein C8R43DRAFT_963049 [Mycena crocata]
MHPALGVEKPVPDDLLGGGLAFAVLLDTPGEVLGVPDFEFDVGYVAREAFGLGRAGSAFGTAAFDINGSCGVPTVIPSFGTVFHPCALSGNHARTAFGESAAVSRARKLFQARDLVYLYTLFNLCNNIGFEKFCTLRVTLASLWSDPRVTRGLISVLLKLLDSDAVSVCTESAPETDYLRHAGVGAESFVFSVQLGAPESFCFSGTESDSETSSFRSTISVTNSATYPAPLKPFTSALGTFSATLNYLFFRPVELSACLISAIMQKNSNKPDGARLWWQEVGDELWEGMLSEAGGDTFMCWVAARRAAHFVPTAVFATSVPIGANGTASYATNALMVFHSPAETAAVRVFVPSMRRRRKCWRWRLLADRSLVLSNGCYTRVAAELQAPAGWLNKNSFSPKVKVQFAPRTLSQAWEEEENRDCRG